MGRGGRGARGRTAAADGAREGVLVALEILAVDEQPVIRAGGRGGGAALGAQVAQEEVEQEGLARAEGPRHRHHRHLHARRHFVEDLGQRRLLELELARILLDRDDLHGGHKRACACPSLGWWASRLLPRVSYASSRPGSLPLSASSRL